MPDFLDSLINRARDAESALRPRTPGLFEPVAAGYGPRAEQGRFRAVGTAEMAGAAMEEHSGPEEMETSRAPRGGSGAPRAEGDADRQPDSPENAEPGPRQRSGSWPSRAAIGQPPRGRSGTAERTAPPSAESEARENPGPRPGPATVRARLERAPAVDAPATSAPTDRAPARVPPRRPSQPRSPEPGEGRDLKLPVRREPSVSPLVAGLRAAEATRGPLVRFEAELEALRPSTGVDPVRTLSVTAAMRTAGPPAQRPLGSGSAPAPAPPINVHVSIGQVEVRASAPSPAASPRPRPGAGAVPMGLDEYLRRRNGGAA